MIDPVVERRYSDCRELMDLWRKYHDFFKIAVAGQGITPEREHEFITVKSRIAMLHDSFMDCLEHDQNIGQNILSIVTRSITLKLVHRMSTAEIKKIELEWHESYLLLNETIGILEDKRNKLAEIKHSDFVRQQMVKKTTAQLMAFLNSWVFKTIVAIVIVMGLIFAAQYFGVIEKLRTNQSTKSFIVKWESMFRAVFPDYPFHELAELERKSKIDTPGVRVISVRLHEQDPQRYSVDAIAAIVQDKLRGSKWDFSQKLKDAVEHRAEAYESQMGGGPGSGRADIWLLRMPTTKEAKEIEAIYQDWLEVVGAQNQNRDWDLFRRSNVIGVATGGSDMFRWLRREYAREKENK